MKLLKPLEKIIGKSGVRFIERRLGEPPTDPIMLAEFDTPGEILNAAHGMRKAGYKDFDVHTPFPIHGMDKAMGLTRSIVPFIVLGGSATGLLGGFLLQYWINVYDYPLVISGKPFGSIPAFVPVMFELTILLSAFGAIGGMLFLNALPELYNPIFKHKRFERATTDKFFISVPGYDKHYDDDKTRELLRELGGQHITVVEP